MKINADDCFFGKSSQFQIGIIIRVYRKYGWKNEILLSYLSNRYYMIDCYLCIISNWAVYIVLYAPLTKYSLHCQPLASG